MKNRSNCSNRSNGSNCFPSLAPKTLRLCETKMEFRKSLFWDVQIDSLDFEKHARFIVERVVSRGNRQDWQLLKKFYGKERIRKEAMKIRSMDQKTVSFLSVYFEVGKNEFRCCN